MVTRALPRILSPDLPCISAVTTLQQETWGRSLEWKEPSSVEVMASDGRCNFSSMRYHKVSST